MGALLSLKPLMMVASEFSFYFVVFLDTWGNCAVEGNSSESGLGRLGSKRERSIKQKCSYISSLVSLVTGSAFGHFAVSW